MTELNTSPTSLTKEEIELLIKDHIERIQVKIIQGDESLKAKSNPKGIPLNGFLEFVRFFSTQASAANRTLALGGIAIIWAFKKPEKMDPIPGLLNWPLLFLAIALALDLIQYFFGAVAWDNFYESKYKKWETGGFKDGVVDDIIAPNKISGTIRWLFYFKLTSMVIAYILLIRFLIQKF